MMKNPLNILLIDDNTKTQDMFGFALNDLNINYSCRFARNVDQAINTLKRYPIDYIFVDVNIPALNSFQVVKKLVTRHLISKTSIVIYTEQPETELCRRALKLGIRAALKKKNEIFELIHDLKGLFYTSGQALIVT